MMPLFEDEIKALRAEIQHVSSTQKMLARPALNIMLDLISPSSVVSRAELLRRYLAQIKAADGVIKVMYPVFVV